MIVEFRDFISTCPYFDEKSVNVNCLEKDLGSVSVELAQSKETVKDYADGGALKKIGFVIALRESFGMTNFENDKIASKCCLIEKWIEEQNLNGVLPKFEGFGNAFSIEVSKHFELVRTNGVSARYEAEVEVGYCKS